MHEQFASTIARSIASEEEEEEEEKEKRHFFGLFGIAVKWPRHGCMQLF